MSSSGPTLIVLGMMGRTPFAGVAWQVLQYVEGFRCLGYDTYYVEDTGDWPYDAERNTVTDDCGFTVAYIARHMRWAGFDGRWAYRSGANDAVYGLSQTEVSRLFERADVVVNLTGATVLSDEHLRVPIRIYLETDPVLPQIEVAEGRAFTLDLLGAHNHHFTYGENLGAPDCGVPVDVFDYRPTRQPIILDWWRPERGVAPVRLRGVAPVRLRGVAPVRLRGVAPVRLNGSADPTHAGCFTTVGSWEQSGKDIEWNGERYLWSKHHEFLKFIDLPRRTTQRCELALALDDESTLTMLRSYGWNVVDAIPLSRDIHPYRDFILGSRGEFTVAKDQNIRLRSGWFSDRSASYLAAGKPVITQDTGFGNVLPTGKGLFAFNTMDDVLAALEKINGDYQRHSEAALAIAEEYFRAERVLSEMMAGVGVPV
jgi:hypothetical protein